MKSISPNRRAFTLVELLIVVAIVLVLASLTFATVLRMQVTAKSASCMSNLRSIGAAFQLYVAENNGMLPALRYRADLEGENPTKKNWQFEINPYLAINGASFKAIAQNSAGRAVFCPAYIGDYKEDKDLQKYSSGGYGMNPNFGGSRNAWDFHNSLAVIAEPAQKVLVGDSDDYHLNMTSSWGEEKPPGERYSSGDPIRHGKTANYLFMDGHVASLNQESAEAALTGKKLP